MLQQSFRTLRVFIERIVVRKHDASQMRARSQPSRCRRASPRQALGFGWQSAEFVPAKRVRERLTSRPKA